MEASIGNSHATRVLCLGNDVLADDALGIAVADELRKRFGDGIDVVTSGESGLRLLDNLLDVGRVIVVDVVQTGQAAPGTVMVTDETGVTGVAGGSPHYIGLFDTVALGRKLGLPVADDLVVIAVEANDCRTLGGAMHPSVRDAVHEVVGLVEEMVS